MSKKPRRCPHPQCGLVITPSSKKGVKKHFKKVHGRSPTNAEISHSVNFGQMPEERNKRTTIPIACEAVAWEFKCPKRWTELEATERENVRHCTSCSQQVYLCTSAAELNSYARQGLCVAWDEKGSEKTMESMVVGFLGRDFPPYPKATY